MTVGETPEHRELTLELLWRHTEAARIAARELGFTELEATLLVANGAAERHLAAHRAAHPAAPLHAQP